jgi:hypothetical protein
VQSVTEVTGVADGQYLMQDLFAWDVDEEKFRGSGVTPSHPGLQRALGQRPSARSGISIG